MGAGTGRDGIHGASMASESLGTDKEKSKTSIQIGDPFYGKLLMEALLEVMQKNLVHAAQDMGAAGIVSSSVEMAVKSGMGMKLYLDQVPLRDATMEPADILLSESQERALLAVETKNVKAVQKVFTKWNICAEVIGQLVKTPAILMLWKEKFLVNMTPDQLKAPQYNRPFNAYKPPKATSGDSPPAFIVDSDNNDKELRRYVSGDSPPVATCRPGEFLLSLLRDERGCSRKFIYRQYDQRVGTNTVKDSAFPVAVLRLPHSGRALGMCLGGRPYIMQKDAFEGGKDAVFKPALELALRGFTPLALSDGLNFGSPENKQVMSAFVHCVEGIREAAHILQTPVVSGNVSFYNETDFYETTNSGTNSKDIKNEGTKNTEDAPNKADENNFCHSGADHKNSSEKQFDHKEIGGVESLPNTKISKKAITGVSVIMCVGLKNSLEVPAARVEEDYGALKNNSKSFKQNKNFDLKNSKIYLLSVHQLQCTGLAGTVAGIPPAMQGALNPARCREFINIVERGVEQKPPVAAAVVGKFGLAYTLARMVRKSKWGIHIKTPYDPFMERFYEAVLVLTESDADFWKSKIKNTNIRLECLGEWIQKPEFKFNNMAVPLKDLNTAYQSGFF